MSKSQALRDFIKAILVFRKHHGHTFITRKEIWDMILAVDPREEYGYKDNPIGRNLTVELMEGIAAELGGVYVKDANGRNARFEF